MDIDKMIEKGLKVLEDCLKEAASLILEACSEKNFISHLLYMKEDKDIAKTSISS